MLTGCVLWVRNTSAFDQSHRVRQSPSTGSRKGVGVRIVWRRLRVRRSLHEGGLN